MVLIRGDGVCGILYCSLFGVHPILSGIHVPGIPVEIRRNEVFYVCIFCHKTNMANDFEWNSCGLLRLLQRAYNS